MPDPSRIALSDGAELAVWESGPRDAPALIFLHGFPENHRAWRHQIAHLCARYRCIAPDLRGYGASSKPAREVDYATPRLIADVFELADALGVQRFTLLGHDWGGLLAWGAAMTGTNRIEQLVIANAPHPALFQRLLYNDPAQRAASQYINLLRSPTMDTVLDSQGLAPVLQQAFGDSALRAIERAELGELLVQWRDPATARAMVNWYRASSLMVPAPDVPPRPLPAPTPITIPTLVLWGEEDAALLPTNLDGLDGLVSDLTIARLPGVGHFSPWQGAAQISAALDGFLA